MKRQQKIKTLLKAAGAESTSDIVATVEIFLEDVPTQYLKHFMEYVLKNYDKYKKPIVNITTASQEYKKRLRLMRIRNGEIKIQSAQKTKDFLLEFFKGQKIANNVKGLYLPLVTISLDDNGTFVSDYTHKKLNSEAEVDFIYWCFVNQEKIGVVELIETHVAKEMLLEHHKKFDALEEKRQKKAMATSSTEIDEKVLSKIPTIKRMDG